jgi:L-asparaginase II
MCASHTGSVYHLGLVRQILQRIGSAARDLACGYHLPLDPTSRAHLETHPRQRSKLYNNCSGKHAGMLCLARSEGWPIRGYDHADHPLQQLMKDTIASLSGVPGSSMTTGVDGCGATTFGMPLDAMARAWARLAVAPRGEDARETSLARIRRAMSRHPVAVGGKGELTTDLIRASGGRWAAKGGAEGLQCLAIPERGLGIVLKAEDGNARGLGAATYAVIDALGLWTEKGRAAAAGLRRPVIRNHAGAEVGHLEATVRHLSTVAH